MPVAINYRTGFSSAWANVATFVPKFIVVLIVGWMIAKATAKVLSAALTRVGFDQHARVLGNVGSRLIPAFGVIAAPDQPHVAASSQYGNGSQPSDESGERHGATRV